MADESYHDHGKSILSSLKFNFDSATCYKTYLVSNAGVTISVSSSFIGIFSKVIKSTTSCRQESNHVVLVPIKPSTIENLLMFLYNGELFSADKEALVEVIEAAKILDIDAKNWSIEYVDAVNNVVECEMVNFEESKVIEVKYEIDNFDGENKQVKASSIKEEVLELYGVECDIDNVDEENDQIMASSIIEGLLDLNEIECKVDDFDFDVENLQIKAQTRNISEGRAHLCQICGEVFTSLAKLTRHCDASHFQIKVEVDIKENQESLTCEYCGYVGPDKSTLRGHIQGKHGEAKFRCDQCPFTTSWKRNLNQHKYSACKNRAQYVETEGVFGCDKCDKLFKSSLGLQCHEQNYHGKVSIESRTCEACGFVGVDKSALRVHIQGKHGDVKFYCEQCTFETNWKSNLEKHKKVCRKQAELLTCNQCKNVYKSRSRLLYHITSFHGKKENVTCEHCGYVGSPKVMKQHIQGKHGEAIFSCDKCSFTSSWRNNVRKHKKKWHKNLLEEATFEPSE